MGQEKVGERLKLIRQNLKLTQKEMADLLGVTLNAYQRYEMGARSLSLEKLKILMEKLNVNLNWLLTGKGEPFIRPEEYNNLTRPAFDKTTLELVNLIKELPMEEQKLLKRLLKRAVGHTMHGSISETTKNF